MDDSTQIMHMLGQISGKLDGMEKHMTANHTAVNQRLDEIQKSNNQRFDALESRVEHVEEEQKSMIWKIASWSSLGGALVAGVVQLLQNHK